MPRRPRSLPAQSLTTTGCFPYDRFVTFVSSFVTFVVVWSGQRGVTVTIPAFTAESRYAVTSSAVTTP